MLSLYISIVDISLGDGYERKLIGQVNAFKSYGWETDIFCFKQNQIVMSKFAKDSPELVWSVISKRISNILIKRTLFLWKIFLHTKKTIPDFIYVRYPRVDLLFALFIALIKISRLKSKLIYEIPTYPYDNENPSSFSINNFLLRLNEKIFRPFVTMLIDTYAVVAYEGNVFGKESIRIENGTDRCQ